MLFNSVLLCSVSSSMMCFSLEIGNSNLSIGFDTFLLFFKILELIFRMLPFKYIIVDGFMFYAGLRRKFFGGYKVPWA